MDVRPESSVLPNPDSARVALLLHGKNFCGATWESTARALLAQGYRVIMPDHIGFCKSSKPTSYQFSLQQLALNTYTLLANLNLTNSSTELTIVGHSLGGMLGTRFALMYPSLVSQLILINPIGLEDWKAKGVPYQSIDAIYQNERTSNYTSIPGYEQSTYYAGTWSPAYNVWVNMLLALYTGSESEPYARIQALITDAVYTQPIIYEFPLLAKTKTLLITGEKDSTAIGKAWSPPDVQRVLGNYSALGKEAVKAMGGNATLVEFGDLGHAPQIQDPARVHGVLVEWLASAV